SKTLTAARRWTTSGSRRRSSCWRTPRGSWTPSSSSTRTTSLTGSSRRWNRSTTTRTSRLSRSRRPPKPARLSACGPSPC
ncbi:unnamed protein product, partial [Ectocarpus fasciculatus]